jgi:serine protease Do
VSEAGASAGALTGLSALPEGELEVGMEVDGVLGESNEVLPNGSWGQVWTFTGRAGERLAIGLSSDDFDPMVYLDGPGLDGALVDDDGGGGLNSRLEVTLPESGVYRVVASALSAGEGGAYRLSVVRRFGG